MLQSFIATWAVVTLVLTTVLCLALLYSVSRQLGIQFKLVLRHTGWSRFWAMYADFVPLVALASLVLYLGYRFVLLGVHRLYSH